MSSDDTSRYLQFKLVPAYGSSSDNKRDDDSSGTATYPDLILDSGIFWDKLRDLLDDSSRIVKIPTVGGETLDLHQIFIEVTTRGGIEQVIMDGKCKEVIETFNLKTEVTNAAYVLRKTYLEMLFELEHVYFYEEPMSSFWAREEALKRLVDESANLDIGLKPGTLLKGVIDGKYEDGYIVTMKAGSDELIGVVYPSSEEIPILPQVDPYAAQEPFLLEENGHMWINLSESGTQVYQEKEDEAEMSFSNSCLAESVAALDAATAAVTKAEAKSEASP